MTTHITKILEEFDDKHRDIFYKINKKGSDCTENKNTIRDFLSQALTSAITAERERCLEAVNKVPTRDGYGAFRHIEVYKDEIMQLIK